MEFLSEEWFKAANQALESLNIGDLELTVAHVTEADSHSIVLSKGRACVSSGAVNADVTLRQSHETAAAVRDGSLDALTAIQEGIIEINGNITGLVEASGALKAVDDLLAGLA